MLRPLHPSPPVVGLACTVLLALTPACATTVPMDARRPIEKERGRYRQNGLQLDQGDMLAKIARTDACRPATRSATDLGLAGSVVAGIGGGLLGGGLGNEVRYLNQPRNDGLQAGLYVAGAVFASLGIGLGVAADGKLAQAVDCHNARLEPIPRRGTRRSTREPIILRSKDGEAEAPPAEPRTRLPGRGGPVDTSTAARPSRRVIRPD